MFVVVKHGQFLMLLSVSRLDYGGGLLVRTIHAQGFVCQLTRSVVVESGAEELVRSTFVGKAG